MGSLLKTNLANWFVFSFRKCQQLLHLYASKTNKLTERLKGMSHRRAIKSYGTKAEVCDK